jgi:hypothetical protein
MPIGNRLELSFCRGLRGLGIVAKPYGARVEEPALR